MPKAAAVVPGQRRARGQGRGPSTETVVRHWKLMQALPTAPRCSTVAHLYEVLRSDGSEVTRRTIERDLKKLVRVMPIEDRPGYDGVTRWAWMRGHRSHIQPVYAPTQAALLILAQRYLDPLLAPVLMKALQPTFTAATRVLNVESGPVPGDWRGKIGAVPPSLPLDRPPVGDHRSSIVVEALLEDRKVRLSYRLGDRIESFTVNPHALVQRELVTYLIATCDPHGDLRALALHRMGVRGKLSTQQLDQPAVRVPGFDLEAYIAAGFEEFQ